MGLLFYWETSTRGEDTGHQGFKKFLITGAEKCRLVAVDIKNGDQSPDMIGDSTTISDLVLAAQAICPGKASTSSTRWVFI